jgi:preprotein translocase subunit SecD
MNKYPGWKYCLLAIIIVVSLIYALPNLYGEEPSIQISSTTAGQALTTQDETQTKTILAKSHIDFKAMAIIDKDLLIKFANTDIQQRAKEALKTGLGEHYIVAISLSPATPTWLRAMGANPMRLGLDLRGGVHFLLQVDVNSVVKSRVQGDMHNISDSLRDQKIRYAGVSLIKPDSIKLAFRDTDTLNKALSSLKSDYPDYLWKVGDDSISGALTPAALTKTRQYTVEQTMQTLNRRVNELGVSEATVQQQGVDRIAVDLPGIQDAAQAQDILGKTATLEFHLVDTTHDPMVAAQGVAPPGTSLYTYEGRPILLKNQVVLTGDAITNANSSFDQQTSRPSVNIRMGGKGESYFYRVTGENIGKPLAVVYIETKSHPVMVNGKQTIVYKQKKRVINSATIQGALGSPFQITGLSSIDEARNLSLLLRAGALVAPVTIVAERNVGPSMGSQNIKQGTLSLEVGLGIVALVMLLYYALFGLIADIALVLNLVILVAIMSLLGSVLTFPGIAGIVLTLGMAVDANVLICERIREEIRQGVTIQTAIHAGYEKAFATIVDANVTTLIAAIVLFSLGTGAIKGFAITITIGILTSMFTSVNYTRAMVNLLYGGKRINKISIGIRMKRDKKGAEV